MSAEHLGRWLLDGDAPQVQAQSLVMRGYKHCLRRTYLIRWGEPATVPGAAPADLHRGLFFMGKKQRCEAVSRLVKLNACLNKPQIDKNGLAFAALDLGLTFDGLQALGLDADLLRVFRQKSPAFSEGAWARAAQHLADTGPSDRRHWDSAWQPQPSPVHMVVLVHLSASQGVSPRWVLPPSAVTLFEHRMLAALGVCRPAAAPPLDAPWVSQAAPLDKRGTVWFGYKDGITRPRYSQQGQGLAEGGEPVHALGELLLGHARNGGDNPFAALSSPERSSGSDSGQPQALRRLVQHRLAFFKDSSFGVLRTLSQDVESFHEWVQARSRDSGLPVDWIKAKLMGRVPVHSQGGLPSGTRLGPDMRPKHLSKAPAPAIKQGEEGGFRQPAKGLPPDPWGHGCPYASHIRRMNPRDDPVVPFIARPLLRRSLPYGTQASDDKGLAGLFFCSDIEKQFEHLVGRWAQAPVMGVVDASTARDPVIGQHQFEQGAFFMADPSGGQRWRGLDQPFVSTRGCLYAWFASPAVLLRLHQYAAVGG